jgi:hypothetical protein
METLCKITVSRSDRTQPALSEGSSLNFPVRNTRAHAHWRHLKGTANGLHWLHTAQRRHSGLDPESSQTGKFLDSGSGAGMTEHFP